MLRETASSGLPPNTPPGALTLRCSRDGDREVIALAGDFELATYAAVVHELDRARVGEAATVVLDLRAVSFMDSCGLRTVAEAHERLGERLSIVPGPANVQRVFEICGFGGFLPFEDDQPRAADPEPITPAAVDTTTVDTVLSAQIARAAVRRRAGQAALASAVRSLRSHDRGRRLRPIA
jgi:anti-sigma B factor antagonist